MTTATEERNWTATGADLVERVGGRDAVETAIGELVWRDVPENEPLTVGFIPGDGINTCIREFKIPRVSKIAIDAFEVPPEDADGDGFYPGFYGVEGNFSNGRMRLYVLDTGTALVPVRSDFWPKSVDDA